MKDAKIRRLRSQDALLVVRCFAAWRYEAENQKRNKDYLLAIRCFATWRYEAEKRRRSQEELNRLAFGAVKKQQNDAIQQAVISSQYGDYGETLIFNAYRIWAASVFGTQYFADASEDSMK